MTIRDYLSSTDDELRKEYNIELVERYPWVVPPDRYDPLYVHPQDTNPKYDYSWTMLDDLPDGWRLAFQDELCEEIQQEYEKLTPDQREAFYIVQTKEKFGGMRMYMSFYVDSIEGIIEKYSRKSECLCVVCGKPATYISTGWICPWCDDHIESDRINGYVKIEEWFKGEDNGY